MNTQNDANRLIYTVPTRAAARSELLAMRDWRVFIDEVNRRLILTSLDAAQVWDGPILRSPWSPDEARGFNTGVHGLKPRFRRYFVEKGWFYGRETWAWGWVALSGLVEEFSGGYRAEWGAIRQLRLGPRSLALHDSVEDVCNVIADLEDCYQCRVKVGYHEWRISRTMIPLRSP